MNELYFELPSEFEDFLISETFVAGSGKWLLTEYAYPCGDEPTYRLTHACTRPPAGWERESECYYCEIKVPKKLRDILDLLNMGFCWEPEDE